MVQGFSIAAWIKIVPAAGDINLRRCGVEKVQGSGNARCPSPKAGQGAGGNLASAEALELLLSFASRQASTGATSALMKRFRGLRGVLDASVDELSGSGWLTEGGAVLVKLVKETAGLYLRERMMGVDAIEHKGRVIDYLTLTLAGERVEKFIALYLGSGNRVISVDVLHEGTINQTVVYPRKVVEKAFERGAAGVIFVHNHPSGDSTPSAMDRQLARTLDEAASAIDLEVIDHIVIGKNNYFSAKEHGWMAAERLRRA